MQNIRLFVPTLILVTMVLASGIGSAVPPIPHFTIQGDPEECDPDHGVFYSEGDGVCVCPSPVKLVLENYPPDKYWAECTHISLPGTGPTDLP